MDVAEPPSCNWDIRNSSMNRWTVEDKNLIKINKAEGFFLTNIVFIFLKFYKQFWDRSYIYHQKIILYFFSIVSVKLCNYCLISSYHYLGKFWQILKRKLTTSHVHYHCVIYSLIHLYPQFGAAPLIGSLNSCIWFLRHSVCSVNVDYWGGVDSAGEERRKVAACRL